jgi:hypothetical protein
MFRIGGCERDAIARLPQGAFGVCHVTAVCRRTGSFARPVSFAPFTALQAGRLSAGIVNGA